MRLNAKDLGHKPGFLGTNDTQHSDQLRREPIKRQARCLLHRKTVFIVFLDTCRYSQLISAKFLTHDSFVSKTGSEMAALIHPFNCCELT